MTLAWSLAALFVLCQACDRPAPPAGSMGPSGGPEPAAASLERQIWAEIDACTQSLKHVGDRGEASLSAQMETQAHDCLDQLLAEHPGNRQLLRELAQLKQRLGDDAASIAAYQRALLAHPGWSLLHSDVARFQAESAAARQAAQVQGMGDAASFAISAESTIRGLPELERLTGVQRGDTVADLGCGSGRYAYAFARWVGPKGRVLAVDIRPEYLDMVTEAANRQELSWIERVEATETSSGLVPGSADLAFMSRVWVSVRHSPLVGLWLASVVDALRPGGRLVVTGEPAIELESLQARLEPLGMKLESRESFPEEGEAWIFTRR